MGAQQFTTDFATVHAIGRDLVDGWRAFVESPDDHFTFGSRDRRPSEGRFASVFALVAHTHQVARPALGLLADGSTIEAAPLVRLMYESSLKSVWLSQHEHAWVSFLREEERARASVRKTLARGRAEWMKRGAAGFPALDMPGWDPGCDAQARNFEALCNDLTPGGADAYIIYRLLSRLSHASVHVADRYMWVDQEREWQGLRADPDRGRDNRDLITYFAVCSLVWAGAAVDYIDPARARRQETREAARKLGIPRDLHLTFQARQRAKGPVVVSEGRAADA